MHMNRCGDLNERGTTNNNNRKWIVWRRKSVSTLFLLSNTIQFRYRFLEPIWGYDLLVNELTWIWVSRIQATISISSFYFFVILIQVIHNVHVWWARAQMPAHITHEEMEHTQYTVHTLICSLSAIIVIKLLLDTRSLVVGESARSTCYSASRCGSHIANAQ